MHVRSDTYMPFAQYFGRVMSRGSNAVHNNTSKTLAPVTTVASTLERLSEAPKRPASFAQAEVDADARRMLAFLQRHGRLTDL